MLLIVYILYVEVYIPLKTSVNVSVLVEQTALDLTTAFRWNWAVDFANSQSFLYETYFFCCVSCSASFQVLDHTEECCYWTSSYNLKFFGLADFSCAREENTVSYFFWQTIHLHRRLVCHCLYHLAAFCWLNVAEMLIILIVRWQHAPLAYWVSGI